MSNTRPPPDPGNPWQRTRPGTLPLPAPLHAPPRVQPPLREMLKGLDVRELEGETVFDQLFGTAAAKPVR
jgi:hypothetical protein